MTLDLMQGGMLALSRDTLTALRSALIRDAGHGAAAWLQEAGYAGGGAVHDSFARWLASRGDTAPEALGMENFQRQASAFFREAGWGTLALGSLGDGVAVLDSEDWGEATPDMPLEYPGCHLSSGLFADFFGRVAEAPLAVMEVECRSAGADRCRFLLGSPEMLQRVYEGMAAGQHYAEAVNAPAG